MSPNTRSVIGKNTISATAVKGVTRCLLPVAEDESELSLL